MPYPIDLPVTTLVSSDTIRLLIIPAQGNGQTSFIAVVNGKKMSVISCGRNRSYDFNHIFAAVGHVADVAPMRQQLLAANVVRRLSDNGITWQFKT